MVRRTLALPLLSSLVLLALAAPSAQATAPARSHGRYSGRTLYVEAGTNAERQAEVWRTTDPDAAAVMDRIARSPVALWLGDWDADVRARVDDTLDRAGDALPVFVVYAIPHRDCGFWSAGGFQDGAAYRRFVAQVAAGLQGRDAIVVLEPDGLPLTTCLDEAGVQERYALLSGAVDTLGAAGAAVYLDAGDSNWIPAPEMAQRLVAAGVARAAGFSLNVSHTEFTEDEVAYAEELRGLVGVDAHYVIDTSRSGLGPSPDDEWCNPLGRALGPSPTLDTPHPGLDGLLWIKPPGESDGSCNGGPPAGQWWPEYAHDLGVAAGL